MQYHRTTIIFWAVILIFLVFLSVVFTSISADAPYYLAVSRDISRGLVPYKEINNIYTPLMMYLNSLIWMIFKNPDYEYFLLFQYFIILCSSVMIFKLSRKKAIGKIPSIFLSLFFAITVLSSDGTYINLEVYILLFTLISFWLLFEKRFFWCGFFLSLGFFFKQYGIFNFFPFLLLIIIGQPFERKQLLLFFFGALVPVAVFLSYFIAFEGVSIEALIHQLTGGGYGQRNMSAEKTFFGFIAGAKVFILLIISLLFLRIPLIKNKVNIILALGILINLIPIIIQNYQHYYILTYPYIFMLMLRHADNFDKKFFLASNTALILISGFLFLRIFRYKDNFAEQQKIAEMAKQKYPVGSKVFLMGEIRYLYLLNDYQNPVLSEVGYSYEFVPDENFKEKYNFLSLQ